jgi:hypothetical protein
MSAINVYKLMADNANLRRRVTELEEALTYIATSWDLTGAGRFADSVLNGPSEWIDK